MTQEEAVWFALLLVSALASGLASALVFGSC